MKLDTLPAVHYWSFVRSQVDANARIVDLGCGDLNTWKRGHEGRHDRVPPDLPRYPHLTAVDYDGIDPGDFSCTFVQADIAKLPFPADSFDVAILSQVLEHVPDPPAVVREALRVAPRLIITIPLGSHPALESEGDTMAERNPWVRFTEFVPDTVFPHHAHVRVLEQAEDLLPWISDAAVVTLLVTGTCDGGAWAGAVVMRA